MGVEFLRRDRPAAHPGILRASGYAESARGPVEMREHPCTYVPVVIDVGEGWRVVQRSPCGTAETRIDSFVAGLTEGPVLVGHDGRAACVQVDLSPLAARRLLGVPMSELANRTVPLDDALGRWARELGERVADTDGWVARIELVERAVAEKLAAAAPPRREIAWALAQVRSPAAPPVAAIAAELGWSHRRLIARFRDEVGLPPKRVARIARLERLESTLRTARAVDWARLAASCGFADQQHMAREVRALTGLTPTALRIAAVNFVHDTEQVPP